MRVPGSVHAYLYSFVQYPSTFPVAGSNSALHLHQVVRGTCTPELSIMLGTRRPGRGTPPGGEATRGVRRRGAPGADRGTPEPSRGRAARTGEWSGPPGDRAPMGKLARSS